MTRDIFNPPVSTLDVIVYAVLVGIGWTPENFIFVNGDFDNTAKRNALRFLAHFEGRKIHAIKAIREVSGLGLKDAKEAFEQIIESYGGGQESHYRNLAVTALEDGRYDDAVFYTRSAQRYSS